MNNTLSHLQSIPLNYIILKLLLQRLKKRGVSSTWGREGSVLARGEHTFRQARTHARVATR